MAGSIVGCVQYSDRTARRRQWVGWRLERRNGRQTKVPYDAATGLHASSTDPDTWHSFDRAVAALRAGRYAGVGFVFAKEDPFAGVDLDHCRDARSGEITAWASQIIDRLGTWAHVSPSRAGIHVIGNASLPDTGRKTAYADGAVEMYDRGRFFTITTAHLEGTPLRIEPCQDELLELHREIFAPTSAKHAQLATARIPNDLSDQQLLERAFSARNGAAVADLWSGSTAGYGSASEADLALCNHLAFWTGRDPARIDYLFRSSGLFRPKWDERRGN